MVCLRNISINTLHKGDDNDDDDDDDDNNNKDDDDNDDDDNNNNNNSIELYRILKLQGIIIMELNQPILPIALWPWGRLNLQQK